MSVEHPKDRGPNMESLSLLVTEKIKNLVEELKHCAGRQDFARWELRRNQLENWLEVVSLPPALEKELRADLERMAAFSRGKKG